MSKPAKQIKTVDYQRMIDTAVAFFLAGERCEPDFSFGKYPNHSLGAPVIVSYALSVEIGLKLLNRHYGLPADGHDVQKLFEALPQSCRDHLSVLQDAIPEILGAFVDWRYAYEHEYLEISPNELRRSFIVVHAEIRRLMPGLKSVYERNWGYFDPDWHWTWPERQIEQIEKRLGR